MLQWRSNALTRASSLWLLRTLISTYDSPYGGLGGPSLGEQWGVSKERELLRYLGIVLHTVHKHRERAGGKLFLLLLLAVNSHSLVIDRRHFSPRRKGETERGSWFNQNFQENIKSDEISTWYQATAAAAAGRRSSVGGGSSTKRFVNVNGC